MRDLQAHLHEKQVSFRNAAKTLGAAPWTAPLAKPVPPWHVPGLLQSQALHVLTSDSGACKSWLGLELMLAGIYGIPVLGQLPEKPFSSIYLAADSPDWDIGQQLRKLMLAHGLAPDPDPTSFILPLGFVFDNRHHIDALSSLVEHWEIDAFFIDVMLYTHHQNENDNGAMARSVYSAAKHLRDNLGLAVYFLHHNSKPTPDAPGGFRGAGTIVQAAEHHFALAPHAESIDLIVKKIRGDKLLPPVISFRLSDKPNGGKYLERIMAPPPEEGQEPIIALLSLGPASRAAITMYCAQYAGMDGKSVDNKLQYLRKQGLIVNDGRGNWSCVPAVN